MKIAGTIPLIIAVTLTAFVALTFTAAQSTSEKWSAPSGEAAKRNSVSSSQSSIAAGQKIYGKRCVGCHGSSGNGDGPDAADLGIHPAKLSQIVGTESDGALFWKISTGKKPMPGFGSGSKRLSETDRWNVINYIRTLARK